MPKYWDFRTILDVDPEYDDRCVAIKAGGIRCEIGGNFMNRGYLVEAATILDTMDQTESLSECRGYLNDLAYLTVCGSPHRKMKTILDDRCRRWNRTISTYVACGVQDERRKAHANTLDTEKTELTSLELGKAECAEVE
jgi:hypothetical protein